MFSWQIFHAIYYIYFVRNLQHTIFILLEIYCYPCSVFNSRFLKYLCIMFTWQISHVIYHIYIVIAILQYLSQTVCIIAHITLSITLCRCCHCHLLIYLLSVYNIAHQMWVSLKSIQLCRTQQESLKAIQPCCCNHDI